MPGAIITKQEEGTFLMLFNRSGYVLTFSTNALVVAERSLKNVVSEKEFMIKII